MFAKLSLLALVAPLVSALTISAPSNPTSGGSVTITWTTISGDPPIFSIELVNTAFNNQFAIANNVDVSLGTITLTLPIVPVGAGYTIAAVDVSNIDNVFSTTGSFSVGAITSVSTTTAQSTTTTGTGTTTATSATAPTLSVTTTTRPTTTGSVSIASGAGTGSGTGAGTGTGTGTGAAASGSASGTPPSSGALQAGVNAGALAAVALGAVAMVL